MKDIMDWASENPGLAIVALCVIVSLAEIIFGH